MGKKLVVGVIVVVAVVALLIGSFFLFGQGTFTDTGSANDYQPIPASCSNEIDSCINYVAQQSGEPRSTVENNFAFRCVQSSCEGKLK